MMSKQGNALIFVTAWSGVDPAAQGDVSALDFDFPALSSSSSGLGGEGGVDARALREGGDRGAFQSTIREKKHQ